MSVFLATEPEWLKDQKSSCESCGHWSSFAAGFEYEGDKYIAGWYADEISCYNWISYNSWLYDKTQGEWDDGSEGFDTAERFREFLTETDTDEAQQILDELNRLGL